MFVGQQDWLQPSQSAAPSVASMSASFSSILHIEWAERIPLDCIVGRALPFVAMSRSGLAADGPPIACRTGVLFSKSSSGPFMVSAGPDGCMRSTCMYVLRLAQ